MPRNSSGIYTLPGGNPVTPGDVIEAAWANTTLEDVADALTNSLSRTGAGGMLAPFRIADGSISAPGLSYLNETNTGLYRSGSGSTWMAVLGVNVAQFSTVGVTIPFGKALTAQGNASVSGTFAVTGAATFGSTLALTGALTATGGVVGNVTGNVTAGSGTSTFNDVVITGSLDMTAGSSATITGLSTPINTSDAANKGYVDTQDALRLALTGGTMSGAIAMGSSKITGLGTPTADQDAATKAYVDSVAQGLDVKGSCRAATTANITLSGAQTIDGVAIIAGDRVLVKDQSSAANNGIYVAAAGAWSRATDADTWSELVGAFTFVEEGTVNDNSGWVCTSPAGGTLGVTAVTWEQFSGAGQITAGAGMYKSGNTLNVGTASSSRIVVNTDDIDLATTGVTASTYKSVTVDAYGRVTAGTNPTTLTGFGITDAYTKTEVDAGLALKLNLTGGTMSGAIAMGANKITGLADPTNPQDAATKTYIDTIFGSTTSAAASAAAAASSASSAASSATAAASSATAAAGSATSAASSYTTFNNQYLGSKSSDPSTNNTGGALVAGNLYWNSTSSVMKVYDGSAWSIAYVPSGTYLALTGGTLTGNLGFNGTGLRITGDFTNATYNSRLMFQTSTANSATNVGAIPSGTSAQSALEVYGASDTTNTAFGRLLINATQVSIRSAINGTGTYLPFTLWTGGSERFRVNETTGNFLLGGTTDDGTNKLQVTGSATVSGNVGIGTSSPSAKFESVQATSGIGGWYVAGQFTAANYPLIRLAATTPNKYSSIGNNADGGFTFAVNGSSGAIGTEAMYLDSPGNLGLGVTPSAWNSAAKAFQASTTATFWGLSNNQAYVGSNSYYDVAGNFKYIATDYATQYRQWQGAHSWYTAPSGTAGNAITFTQAMTLDASGNRQLGTTSSVNSARDTISFLSSSGGTGIALIDSQANNTACYTAFYSNTTKIGSITNNGNGAVAYNTSSDYRLKNITGSITTSGAYIDSLNPVEGTWKANGSTFVGLIAHEVQEASRTQVATGIKDGEEMQSMDYSNSELIANMIAELKSLRKRLADAGI